MSPFPHPKSRNVFSATEERCRRPLRVASPCMGSSNKISKIQICLTARHSLGPKLLIYTIKIVILRSRHEHQIVTPSYRYIARTRRNEIVRWCNGGIGHVATGSADALARLTKRRSSRLYLVRAALCTRRHARARAQPPLSRRPPFPLRSPAHDQPQGTRPSG